MAGMTVAMLGVPQEKNSVASLNIYQKVVNNIIKPNHMATHLKKVLKLVCHVPVIFAKLILPQFHIVIASDSVNCCDVLDSKVKHIKCQVPLSPDITGNHLWDDLV